MIKIITGKRNCGKTKYLQKLMDEIGPCDGLLSLKVFRDNQFRGYDLYRVSTGKMSPFILSRKEHSMLCEGDQLLGDFVFLSSGIERGKGILNAALQGHKHVIVDEVAQLELRGHVFYEAVLRGVRWQQGEGQGQGLLKWDLYLVVRQGLVDQVIDKFGIKSYRLLEIEGGEVIRERASL
jgi:nucleoside-triphosphatase THEP1